MPKFWSNMLKTPLTFYISDLLTYLAWTLLTSRPFWTKFPKCPNQLFKTWKMQSSVTWTVIQGPIGRFPFNPRQVLRHPDHDLFEQEAPRHRQLLPPHFHPYFRNPVVVRIFSASLGTEKWVWKVHTCATWPPSKASSEWWIWTSTSPCLSGTPWTSGPPPPTFTRHTCRARATGFPTSSFSTLTLAALKAKWDVKSNFVFV